jgi:hypothetical protein
MAHVLVRRIASAAAIVWTLGAISPAHAQLGIGTWVRQVGPSTPGQLTMTVEGCCGSGRRLTYRLGDSGQIMVVESAFDGREVPVLLNGKPSGETMAITLVDSRHTTTVVKMNGKPFGISKSSLSSDGKTLTVENDYSSSVGGNPVGKFTETWLRK